MRNWKVTYKALKTGFCGNVGWYETKLEARKKIVDLCERDAQLGISHWKYEIEKTES